MGEEKSNEFGVEVEAEVEKPKRARKPKAQEPKQQSIDESKYNDHPKFHKFKGE